MCFGNMSATGQKTTNTSSTSTLPSWLESGSEGIAKWLQTGIGQPFTPYEAERVAPLTGMEGQAGDILSGLAGGANTAEAGDLYRTSATAGPQSIDFTRLIDNISGGAGGPEGSIQDYMNPWIEQVLNPQMRAIQEQGAQQRIGIGNQATSAGAFGDTRHGILEGEQLRNEAQLGADTVGRGYSDAFNNAMGLRSNDLARRLTTDQSNAGYAETALNRGTTGADRLLGMNQQGIDIAKALAGAGGTERGVAQAGLDADFSEFMRKQGFTTDQAKSMAQILAMLPHSKTTTGTGTETASAPDNTGWQMLATLSGLFL